MPALSAPLWIHVLLHSSDYILELITAIWMLLTWRKQVDYCRLYIGLFFALSLLGSVFSQWVLIRISDAANMPLLEPQTTVFSFPIFLMLMLYVLECSQGHWLHYKRALWLFLPWLLVGMATLIICQRGMTPLYDIGDIASNPDKPDVWLRLTALLLYMPYGVYAWIEAHRHTSTHAHTRVQALLTLLMTITFILGNGLRLWTFDILHVVFYITVAILALHAEVFCQTNEENKHEAALTPRFMDLPLEERIHILLNEQQIWLNPEITLEEMSHMAGTNRTYLLQKVKELGYRNFSDMINRHRIAHAVAEQKRDPEAKLLDILFASGYRSRTSALRNYKTYTEQNNSIQTNMI